ncbi:MAG TPA: hypothetical protein VF170_03720 [Planctomycetaceae bacterium]
MRRFALAACVLSSAVSLAGCEVVVSGTGGTLPSGRSVTVSSDRPFRTVRAEPIGRDTESVAIGTFGPRKILVEPTEIKVDGTPVAAIPEATKAVTIADEDGRLRIAADGATVYDAEF